MSFIQERAAHISMYRAAVNKNYAQFKISQTHEELKEKERGIHTSTQQSSLSSLKPARQKHTHTFEFERKKGPVPLTRRALLKESSYLIFPALFTDSTRTQK